MRRLPEAYLFHDSVEAVLHRAKAKCSLVEIIDQHKRTTYYLIQHFHSQVHQIRIAPLSGVGIKGMQMRYSPVAGMPSSAVRAEGDNQILFG